MFGPKLMRRIISMDCMLLLCCYITAELVRLCGHVESQENSDLLFQGIIGIRKTRSVSFAQKAEADCSSCPSYPICLCSTLGLNMLVPFFERPPYVYSKKKAHRDGL